jgi:hypothetical protein
MASSRRFFCFPKSTSCKLFSAKRTTGDMRPTLVPLGERPAWTELEPIRRGRQLEFGNPGSSSETGMGLCRGQLANCQAVLLGIRKRIWNRQQGPEVKERTRTRLLLVPQEESHCGC